MSLLILSGFSGCVTDKGDIENTQTQVTLITEGEIEDITKGKDPEQVTNPVENGTTVPSGSETTGPSGNETTVPSGSETTVPSGNETTVPSESETTVPSGSETTVPSGSETTGGTTSEPPIIEDLPGDEDGYQYPQFFANKCHEALLDRALSSSWYYSSIRDENPEILFVDRGESNLDEPYPIVVYAKYSIGEQATPVYARFSFTIDGRAYTQLGKADKYSSYKEYVDKIVSSMESKAVLVSAEVSKINDKQDEVNATIDKNFAKFIDPKFVDAEINFVREIIPKNSDSYLEIYGFGYDAKGKSYSFRADIDISFWSGYSNTVDAVMDLCDGTIPELQKKEITVKPIDSVFTKENQSEQ